MLLQVQYFYVAIYSNVYKASLSHNCSIIFYLL
jgi:hypothetical protein